MGRGTRGHEADHGQVSRIKERVEEKEGIPPAQQRLIYGGKQMYVSVHMSRLRTVPPILLPSPSSTML